MGLNLSTFFLAVTALAILFLLGPVYKFLSSFMQMAGWMNAYYYYLNKPKKKENNHAKTTKKEKEENK